GDEDDVDLMFIRQAAKGCASSVFSERNQRRISTGPDSHTEHNMAPHEISVDERGRTNLTKVRTHDFDRKTRRIPAITAGDGRDSTSTSSPGTRGAPQAAS